MSDFNGLHINVSYLLFIHKGVPLLSTLKLLSQARNDELTESARKHSNLSILITCYLVFRSIHLYLKWLKSTSVNFCMMVSGKYHLSPSFCFFSWRLCWWSWNEMSSIQSVQHPSIALSSARYSYYGIPLEECTQRLFIIYLYVNVQLSVPGFWWTPCSCSPYLS